MRTTVTHIVMYSRVHRHGSHVYSSAVTSRDGVGDEIVACVSKGEVSITGGKCNVNCEKVCRLTKLGGLGILHLERNSPLL
jgi:hypothetical protein